MKRINHLFKTQKAFIGYLTVGDGGLEKTFESAKALIEGGINLLELGVPFSDPIADGAIIQAASQRALENQTTLFDVLEVAKRLREIAEIPIILFTYFNPLYRYLNQTTFQQMKSAGIDGILVVDLPIEESKTYQKQCLLANLAPIYVVTPTTSQERIKKIARLGKGFLYYACRLGTTGLKTDIPDNLMLKIKEIKSITDLPVVVGFGISTPTQTKMISEVADGFVVGSLFVNAIAEDATNARLTALVASLL